MLDGRESRVAVPPFEASDFFCLFALNCSTVLVITAVIQSASLGRPTRNSSSQSLDNHSVIFSSMTVRGVRFIAVRNFHSGKPFFAFGM